MKKALVYAGAVLAVALTSAPAYAVPATSNADGRVRVLRPLQISSQQNLDLQTIVLSGTGSYSATVGVAQDGTPTCPTALVTCSGTMTPARYEIRGAANQTVTITVAGTLSLANTTTPAAPALPLTVSAPGSLNLGATGNTGTTFNIGGSVTVTEATADGQYVGTFNVSADYQ